MRGELIKESRCFKAPPTPSRCSLARDDRASQDKSGIFI